jgi:transcriptional regulator with XRE-family HTH domain
MTSPASEPANESGPLRERRGLSQPMLARLVGISASWLKGIERGTRLPPRLPLRLRKTMV